jgi:hypothetical protein
MAPKTRIKRRTLKWPLVLWAAVLLVRIFSLNTFSERVLVSCLFAMNVGAFWLASRSDIDTDAGLQRASNIILGFMLFQIAAISLLVLWFGR